MADEKWQKVREIFDSALRRKPEERQSYINEVCSEDKTLLAEVESLLSSLDGADSFLETPAVAKVAGVIEADTKKLEHGKCFGHYEIIGQIGAGGMGEVYLAKDTKLDRRVAIKILNEKFSLDESNLNRFIREAKVASALDHPNILVIHEIGEAEDTHYIVSEFIKGKTLRDSRKQSPLKLSEILDILIQIANALVAAHDEHLIHRDIKPENIMIRPDGVVKVLDFGLAKLVEQKVIGLEESTVKQNQTAKGLILGTVNYMSPEQAKGEKIDERTDIFSFGVVLYEMITGRTPFAGDSMSETFANLINTEPQPLSRFSEGVPDELQRIVSKTLRKKKDERYQTMKGLLGDLKDLRENLAFDERLEKSHPPDNKAEAKNETKILQATTGDANLQTAEMQNMFSQQIKRHKPLAAFALIALLIGAIGFWFYFSDSSKPIVADKKSIAVLPLQPINTASRDEIYEVGIADSLINRLSSMKGFVVRPLSAIRKYVAVEQDPIAAGREQQVDYVLASNYQLANGKIRVTSQLFNVANGQIEETYKGEKDASDLFKMQDAIAGEIGNILLARFATTSSSPTTKRGTDNEEAYRLYLQGLYLYDRRTKPDAYKAIEVLEQAVRLDPNYARAWAGLAHAHRYLINLDVNVNIHDETQKSMEAVNKALALDNNISEAYSALCDNKLNYEYDFAGAETACKRAIELKPESAIARNIYTRFLMSRGRFDEAIAEIKTAIDLEPTSYFHQVVYAACLAQARRYDEALRQMDRLAELNPNTAFGLYWGNNGALLTQENPAKAFERTIRYMKLANADEQTIRLYQTIYQTAGLQGVMREYAGEIGENLPEHIFYIAAIYAQIGDKDKAMEFLEKSYERREFWMAYLQVEPRLDSLRGDPRFEELIRRVESK